MMHDPDLARAARHEQVEVHFDLVDAETPIEAASTFWCLIVCLFAALVFAIPFLVRAGAA